MLNHFRSHFDAFQEASGPKNLKKHQVFLRFSIIQDFSYFGSLNPYLEPMLARLSPILTPNGPRNGSKTGPKMCSKTWSTSCKKRNKNVQKYINFGSHLGLKHRYGQKHPLSTVGPREPQDGPKWNSKAQKSEHFEFQKTFKKHSFFLKFLGPKASPRASTAF